MYGLRHFYQTAGRRIAAAAVAAAVLLSSAVFTVAAADPDPAAKVKIVRETDTVSGDITQKIQVTGAFPVDFAGRKVTLTISDPKAAEGEDLEKYLGIRETVIEKDGSFTFLCLFHAPAGDYRASIMADTMEKPVSYDFFVSSIDDIMALFEQLEAGSIDKNTLLDKLDTQHRELGLDGTIYKSLNQLGRLSVCEAIIKDFKQFTVDAFVTFFDTAVIVNGLDTAQAEDTVKNILAYYDKEYIKLSGEPLYSDYNALDNKNNVYSGMLNETYGTLPDVRTAFNKNVVFGSFKSIHSSSQIGGLIEKYKDYLAFDPSNSVYLKYKQKIENYLGKMMSQFRSLDQIIEKLNDIIANPTKYFPDPTNVGGGGGGGGSSSKPSGTVELNPDIGQTEIPDDLITSSGFQDVPDDYWGKEAIAYLSGKGIVSGRDKERFCPEETITRAEFTKIMMGALKFSLEGVSCSFEDVKAEDWHYRYVAAGAENGIIKGTDENKFYPDDSITRQDAALLLKRALEQKGIQIDKEKTATFTDEGEISDYAREAVGLLAGNHLIKGFDDNTFRPFASLTRAEAAQLIYNAVTAE